MGEERISTPIGDYLELVARQEAFEAKMSGREGCLDELLKDCEELGEGYKALAAKLERGEYRSNRPIQESAIETRTLIEHYKAAAGTYEAKTGLIRMLQSMERKGETIKEDSQKDKLKITVA